MRVRSGFTLLELLVVISIIGLLLAVTIPAVQRSREAARRSICANHLRQVGIALANHSAQTQTFPSAAALRKSYFSQPAKISDPADPSAFYDLLPALEQTTLFNSFNIGNRVGGFTTDSPVNQTATRATLAVLLCPSDRWADPARPTSYRFNVGVPLFNVSTTPMIQPVANWDDPTAQSHAGAFTPAKLIRERDFLDGLSHTVGVTERLIGTESRASFDPPFGILVCRNQSVCRANHGQPDRANLSATDADSGGDCLRPRAAVVRDDALRHLVQPRHDAQRRERRLLAGPAPRHRQGRADQLLRSLLAELP